LKHFNTHTKGCIVGAYRLLIIDGYKSHNLLKFQEIYKENDIITLCMLLYLLYLLQPLDIGCFSLLKKAYRSQIGSLIRSYINHITKLEFLPAFKAAFKQSITKDNIYAGFQGAGLVPYDPDAVLLKLNIKLYTPPLLALLEALWEFKILSNACELEFQLTLVCN
jgi:hypothetical protein